MKMKVEMAEQHEDKEGFLKRSDMTLRDYFAGQALAWMLENQKDVSNALKDVADNSYLAADAMLEARK